MALTRDSLQKYLSLLNQNNDTMDQEEVEAPQALAAPQAPAVSQARDPFAMPTGLLQQALTQQAEPSPAPAPLLADATPQDEEPTADRASGLQAMLKQLQEAQSQKDDMLRLGAMQNAFSKIGAGVAGHGAKATPINQDFIKAMAEQPVNKMTEKFSFTKLQREAEDEDALRDPESSISQLYQQQAAKQGLEVEPNMSANDIKELIKLQKERTNRGYQQSQFIEKDSGDPLVFDPNTSQYMNALTKESVAPGNVIRNYMKTITNPLTGEIVEVRPGQGVVGTIAGQGATQSPEDKESKVSVYQRMNPKEREYLNKDATQSFQDETKAMRESLSKVDRVAQKTMEAVTNPIAASQLGAEVATIFENGRLTDDDVVRYTIDKGWVSRFNNAMETAINGTITKEQARLIQDTLKKYSETSKRLLSEKAQQKAKLFQQRASQEFNIDDVSRLIYGDYEPPVKGKSDKDKNTKKTKEPPPGTTKVRDKRTGKLFGVPNENLEKLLKTDKFELVK